MSGWEEDSWGSPTRFRTAGGGALTGGTERWIWARFLVGVFVLLAVGSAFAQVDEDGPLATSPLFQKDNALGNIVVMYSDTDGPSSQSAMRQTSFDYVPPNDTGLNAGLLTQEIQLLEERPDIQTGFFGASEIDLVVDDFDGDAFDEFAAVWLTQTNDIRVLIPQDLSRQGTDPVTNLPTLAWTLAATLDLVVEAGLPPPSPNHRLRMVSGNFDADPEPELALAYFIAGDAGTTTIQVVLIDTDGTLVPQVTADVTSTLRTLSGLFDLVAGDFDDDGVDEIAVLGPRSLSTDFQWFLEAEVFESTPGGLVTGADTKLVAPGLGALGGLNERTLYYFVAGAGDVNSDPGDALAVTYKMHQDPEFALDAEQRLATFRVNLATGRITTQASAIAVESGRIRLPPIAIDVADLDGDEVDEIVLSTTRELHVYSSPTPSTLSLRATEPLRVDGDAEVMHRMLAVTDLDPDPGAVFSAPEIVFATHFAIGFCCDTLALLQVFGVDAPGGAIDLQLLVESSDTRVGAGNAPNVIAVGAGLLNGPDVRLGQPRRFSETTIATPLVILAAPPLHFDLFGSQVFDVNGCFPEIVFCGQRGNVFVTSYEKKTVTNTNVTTEFHSDWTLSAGISGEVSGLGAKVEGSLKGTYGEGFSRVASERRTETLSVVQRANVDDWIYASTVTHDVWEYPVFLGGETVPTGYVAVVRPRFDGIQLSWFNSKSWLASSFQPSHEVTNLLSYREIAAPEEATAFEEEVRWSTSDLRTIAASGSGSWSLGSEDVTVVTTSNSAKTRLEASLATEAGFDFGLGDFGVGSAKIRSDFSGDYSQTFLSTREMSLEQSVGINFDFGKLDGSVGQTNYGVIPYVYWTKSGALVLDFAVRPELAAPGFPETFWQERYGTGPDPTFILPWRLDPEKGLSLGNDPVEVQAKREQTRDIRLDPVDPRPGETVMVSARIQNYSLLPSPGVEIHFYLGDPDRGGVRIFPDGGASIMTGLIGPRESDIVSFDWTLPQDIEIESSRVYAVLDPNNDIPNEIHEGNNKAWNALAIPVPEPGSLLLQLAGLCTLLFVARRRRRVSREAQIGRERAPAEGSG